MIIRGHYINELKAFIDKPIVKVLTGIRRSGKSTVLKLLKKELLKTDVQISQIIDINLESFNYIHLTNATALYNFIKKNITNSKKHYLLLDEIQEVREWEEPASITSNYS